MEVNMICGSMVALITPMHAGGEVDYENLERLLNLHMAAGTAAVVIGGTTGEAATLSMKEQADLISASAKICGKKIAVVAGIGANSTSEAIELASMAKESGAHSGLAVAPYYVRPNQVGLVRHFETVAEATKFPQILYNIPARTGVDIHDSTILELSKNPLIVGLKDATSDMARAAKIISAVPPHFACYSGDDSTALAFMLLGGHGTISVIANILPKTISKLCHLAMTGNVLEARGVNAKLISLYQALSVDTNPMPIKYAMAISGMSGEALRLPLVGLDPSCAIQLVSAFKKATQEVEKADDEILAISSRIAG